ncbi:hypothetical protein [Bacillus paramycoides]|uniref:Uncharacterized protein n=1 Tax=Bacillus paramycoides TaxID=2026194 RepID=A0ABU6N1J8_9BACI|nr:hypothetical protein [Bacillus paramycoides]
MKKEKLLFWINITSMITILSSIIYLAFAASIKKDTLTQLKKAPNIPSTIQDSNNTEDSSGYWTKEKMKNALPVDIREDHNK